MQTTSRKRTGEHSGRDIEKKPRNAVNLPKGFFDSEKQGQNEDSELDEEWARFEKDIARVEGGENSKLVTNQPRSDSLLPNLKATIEAPPVGIDGQVEAVLETNVAEGSVSGENEEDEEDAVENEREIQQELLQRVAALKEKRETIQKTKTCIQPSSKVTKPLKEIDASGQGIVDDDDDDDDDDYSDEDIFKSKGLK
jgi:hypothetical protein